jgi:hypothetical protein
MSESVCSQCNQKPSLKACICNQNITPLCKLCIGEHIDKYPDYHHSFISIEYSQQLWSASNSLKILKDHLRAKRWELDLFCYKEKVVEYIRTIEDNRDALLEDIIHTTQQNITNLTQLIDQIDYNLLYLNSHMNFPHENTQRILDNLEKYGLEGTLQISPKDLVMECSTLHDEIKNLIKFTPTIKLKETNQVSTNQRVEESQSTDSEFPVPEVAHIFNPVLASIISSSFPKDDSIFDCDSPSHPIYSPTPQSYLYHLLPDTKQLIQYDVSTNSIQILHITSPTTFPENYSMCKLPDGNLFICGGYSAYCYMKEAFIIDLITLKKKNLPDMNYERGYHACIYHGNSVYTFGGKNDFGSLSSCEEFNFQTSKWQSLGYMKRGVNSFNVCEIEGKIYIPSIGYFDPLNKKIDYIGLNIDKGLPIPIGSSIHLLSSENTRIQIVQPAHETEEITYTGVRFWSYSFGIHFKSKFYFINQGEKVIYEYDPKQHITVTKISF